MAPSDAGTGAPARCFGTGDELYERYHDLEWGMPVTGERELYERLCLELFQSGLSWLTILRKRDNFRRAFRDFDIDSVAGFGDDDVARLMADAGIVRNRAKIEASIANAVATLALHDEGLTLSRLVWSHAEPVEPAPPQRLGDLAATSDASHALAKELRRRGFRFVGPTTLHSTLQACGIRNDHLATCPSRAAVEARRLEVLQRQ